MQLQGWKLYRHMEAKYKNYNCKVIECHRIMKSQHFQDNYIMFPQLNSRFP